MVKSVLYGTLAYLIAVFPLAFVWHLVIFKDRFRAMGYLGREQPVVALGFVAILVQGIIVSALFAGLRGPGGLVAEATRICVPLMALIWTAQVLAHAAKFEVDIAPFVLIESAYFVCQAVLVALAMAAAVALAR